MTIEKIYEKALYLGEKTNDSTGYIDDEYEKQHKMKAIEIIKQCIAKLALIENIEIIHPERLEYESEVRLPDYITNVVIPTYTAAILCHQDGEENKYNILIYEYQQAVENIKHDEEKPDYSHYLEGLV